MAGMVKLHFFLNMDFETISFPKQISSDLSGLETANFLKSGVG